MLHEVSQNNWSLWLAITRAEKLVFIRGNASQAAMSDEAIMLALLDDSDAPAVAIPAEVNRTSV